jgi:Tol biopolymer transport system component
MKAGLATILLAGGLAASDAITQDSLADRAVPWPPAAGQSGTRSADGRCIAYVDRTTRELNIWDAETGTAREITRMAAEGGEIGGPVISWDCRLVAFRGRSKGQGQALRLISATAADPAATRVLTNEPAIAPLEWSKDGTRLLVINESSNPFAIGVVDVASGALRVLKSIRPSWLRYVTLSPDGSFVAYDVRSDETDRRRSVFLLRIDDGTETPLLTTPHWNSVVGFTPDGGSLVVLSDRSGSIDLWRLPIAKGRLAGEPVLLKSGFDGIPRALTARGSVLYQRPTGPPAAKIFTVAIDADGRSTGPAKPYPVHDSLAFHRYPRWSTDGTSFMYLTSRQTGPAISIRSPQRELALEVPLAINSLLTFAVTTFEWSPDRRSVVFRRGDGLSIVDVESGVVRNIATGSPNTRYFHPQFTRNGRTIAHFKSDGRPPEERWSYVERDLDSNVERVIVDDLTEFMRGRYPASRSPDGRFLLAMVYGDAQTTLFAYDSTTSEVRQILRVNQPAALNHYGDLRWMPDGRAVVGTLRNATLDDQEIWWIPVDGRPATKIEVGVAPIGETAIAIHPNGREIAFVGGYPIAATMPLSRGPRDVGAGVEFRVLDPVNR